MANPNDAHDRAFYNAEMRPVVRALIGTLYATVQEARSIATDPVIERSEKFRRIESLNIGVDTQFLVDFAYWLPWDEIRPGIDPNTIEQYRAR
jgi:hypothetical protein